MADIDQVSASEGSSQEKPPAVSAAPSARATVPGNVVAAEMAPEKATKPISLPVENAAEPVVLTRRRSAKPRVAKATAKKIAKPVVKAKPGVKKVAKPAGDTTPEGKVTVKQAAVRKLATQKETTKMATKTKTPEFAAKFQESFKDASEKAKVAFGKSQAAFGDAGEFAKGNVEAVVESTKILANGVKSMGEAYVVETRSAYEAMTSDIKQLAAVKSPVEFFELQSKLFRKNFDAAVAAGSKKSEQALKLANEAFQPISTRMSLAMEKFKHAA